VTPGDGGTAVKIALFENEINSNSQ
jgi:hypothetical protein